MSFFEYFTISYWQNYLQIPLYSPNYSGLGGFQIFGQAVLMYFFILITAFALAAVSIMESMDDSESSLINGKEEEGSSFSNIMNPFTNTEPTSSNKTSNEESEGSEAQGSLFPSLPTFGTSTESENKVGGRIKHKKRTYKKKSKRI